MAPKNPFEDDEPTVSMTPEERAQAQRPRGDAARPVTSPGRPKVSGPVPAAPAPPRTSSGARPRFESSFDGQDTTRPEVLLGTRATTTGEQPAVRVPTREQMKALASRFDGLTAGGSVVRPPSRLAPLDAELKSTPGARSPLLSRVVLDQFAPEVNPRYARGEAGHLFVWDYTQAMGCPVPRFQRAGGELTLTQLCAWFRTLSTDAGWVRISELRATELAAAGAPVVALPSTRRVVRIAVARPDARDEAGAPLLASACAGHSGNQLTVLEAFGEPQADYWFHD